MNAERRVTLRGQWLGQQLNRLRHAAGLTLDDAAEFLNRSNGTMSRFESGIYPIRRPDVMALLDLYGVDDESYRGALVRLSQEVWHKGWWDGYADDVVGSLVDLAWLENRATEIWTFDVVIPYGLLQTRDYATELIEADDPRATEAQIDRWVQLRMARQDVLDRDEPPRMATILDESVLRRAVGGIDIQREQLEYLATHARRPNIDIRVLPYGAGAHASMAGTFAVMRLTDPFPAVAYVESPAGGIYVETPDADRYVEKYHRLWDKALGADESAALIAAAMKELE